MDLRFNRVGAVAASILLLVVALVGASAFSRNLLGPSTLPPGEQVRDQATGNFDQLVVVLMENKNLDEVYGPAAYMTQLADLYSFSEGWPSITNPSQPNYISILGGSTFGVSGDGNHPNLNHPTIVDVIENSGHTWKAFAESAGGSGCGLNPPRGEDHFPFLSYTTITGNSARCANLVSGGPTQVVAALNAGTSFIWLTPTDNHNMHDNSASTAAVRQRNNPNPRDQSEPVHYGGHRPCERTADGFERSRSSFRDRRTRVVLGQCDLGSRVPDRPFHDLIRRHVRCGHDLPRAVVAHGIHSVAVRGHDGISPVDESGRGAVHRRRYAPTPASSTSSATPGWPRRAILLQPRVARREHGDLLRRIEFDLVERRAPGPLGLGR